MVTPATEEMSELTRELWKRALRYRNEMSTYEGYRRYVLREPWPHLVHYGEGRIVYASPDQFCWLGDEGVSDCVWMVPGAWS